MTDWNKLKVVDLKTELKKRGLPQSGLKAELVARLTAAENEEGSESDKTIQNDVNKANTDSVASPDTIAPFQPSPEVTAEPPKDIIPDVSEKKLEPIDEVNAPETVSAVADFAQENIESRPSQVIDTTETSQPPSQPTDTGVSQPILTTESSQPQSQPIDTTESSLPPSQPAEQPEQQPAEGVRSAEISVAPREVIEDRQKRKRRSQSPPPNSEDVARKRPRPDESIEEVATTKGDAEWVERHNAVNAAEVNDEAKEVEPMGVDGPTIVDNSKEEVEVEKASANEDVNMQEVGTKMDVDVVEELKPNAGADTDAAITSPENSRIRDSRFKELFSAQKQEDAEATPSIHETSEVEGSYNPVSPAIHPATSALYIRNFIRPLQETRLHDHLTNLATAPGNEPDPNIIVNIYIDRFRTHSIVQFKNLSAAARVRSGMHDRIWPDEPLRKALWVDFIPDEKVEEWINTEQTAGMGRNTKKWEVIYEESAEDGERCVTATLQEMTGDAPSLPAARHQSISYPPPTGPRGIEGAPSGPRNPGFQRPLGNVRNLGGLFIATTAQPTLYWQPVAKDLVDKRLGAMEDVTTKDTSRHLGSEINRYTFEDGDKLVDRGREIFAGIRPPPGHRSRGGGGGGYLGQRQGGYGGRGGDRGYDRSHGYDSYRAPPRDSRDSRRY